MKIIISPAKKMNIDTDSFPCHGLPCFLDKTGQLLKQMRCMSYGELKNLWKCNEQIAKLNVQRLETMDLYKNLTPAILAYEGIQYQYMAPGVFSRQEFSYIEEHLRILSGFYGVLRPFDGVTPYRLEMQAKLKIGNTKDLYEYWGDSIAQNIFSQTGCIINLASKEYSRCISPYLTKEMQFITCVFGERKGEKIIEKGTMCKMARGEMVRYLAQRQVESPEEIQAFDYLGYRYVPEKSNEGTYVFIKET